MFYVVFVVLTMIVLPAASILIEVGLGHGPPLWLIGKWSVFWMAGVRLFLAGLRQYLQPGFTRKTLLGIDAPEADILVQELGVANAAAGVVGLASIAVPTFVLPAAISAGLFYAVAAIGHMRAKDRGGKETLAMATDALAAVVLLGFAIAAMALGR